MSANSIFVLRPYLYNGVWVFDDEATGLVREAFVAGADLVMDDISKDIPSAGNGFVLLFSHQQFPGFTHSLTKVEPKPIVGTNYICDQTKQPCWLCPALFLYYPSAPDRLFAQGVQIRKEPKISARPTTASGVKTKPKRTT